MGATKADFLGDIVDKNEAIRFDNSIESAVTKYLKNKHSRCMYPGCDNYAINSHSISEKVSLGKIAEDQHLYTPKSLRQYPDKKFFVSTKGIQEASIFKGFCTMHELLFERLDNCSIISEKDIFRQCFRTTSYILFQEELMNVIRPLMVDQFRATYQPTVPQFEYPFIEAGLAFAGETINSNLDNLRQYLNNINFFLETLDDQYEAYSLTDFTHPDVPIYVAFKRLSFQIPIAINSQIRCVVEGRRYPMDVLVTLMPYQNSSDLIIMMDKHSHPLDLNHIVTIINDDLKILNFIEKTMISSDNWWLKPSIFDNLSDERKRIFIEDLRFRDSFDIFSEYDLSIFDDLRLTLLQNCSESQRTHELNKMKQVPSRESFNKRAEIYKERIIRQLFGLSRSKK